MLEGHGKKNKGMQYQDAAAGSFLIFLPQMLVCESCKQMRVQNMLHVRKCLSVYPQIPSTLYIYCKQSLVQSVAPHGSIQWQATGDSA